MCGKRALRCRYRLLIVDDHVLFREGLLELLRAAGMIDAALGVGGAREAIRSARSFRPDVAVIDVTLPDGCPFDTARRILSCCALVRLLFLDEAIRVAHVQAALQIPGCGYWTKHAAFGEVAEAIRSIAGGRPTFCPAVQQHLVATSGRVRYRPPAEAAPLAQLTARELQVLGLLVQGLSVRLCAQQLCLSQSTVDNHKARLMKKLGIHKMADLVRLAVREGLIAPYQPGRAAFGS